MPTVASWNLGGNVAPPTVAAFAREWDADILVLAEDKNEAPALLRELNHGGQQLYFADPGESDRLTILTRFPPDQSILLRDSPGVSIRHYRMPHGDSLLLTAVHLSSKLRKKTEDQILASTRLARYIREAEHDVGHRRTIVIGDLNMNPFEAGVVGSEGLHGVMDRRIASGGSRVVQGEDRTFFYNPMWAKFGDGGLSPPGTYYYNSGSEVNYFWNMFDQVLLRPALLNSLAADSVTVVTEVNGVSLLTNHGRPNRAQHSDHLPLVCRLNEILEPVDA